MKLTDALLAIGMALVAIDASAQTEAAVDATVVKAKPHKWYVRAGGGYAFTFAGQTDLSGLDIPISGGNKYAASKIRRSSYGQGATVGLAAGYMITPNIGVEVGISSLIGPVQFHAYEVDIISERYLDSRVQNLTYAIPSLIFRTNAQGKVRVYGSIGAAIPLMDELKINEWGINDMGPNYKTDYTLKNYFTIGVSVSAGVSYNISKRLSVWLEGNLLARNTYTRKLETTAYSINNEDELSTLSTRERVTEYKFDYSLSTYNANQPQTANTFSIPFSSIGLSAGIKLSL